MGSIVTKTMRRYKSLCQGNSDAPLLVNHIIDVDIIWFFNECQQREWGFRMKAGYSDEISYYLCILVFADNFWIIGKSPGELEGMTKLWQERMASLGWTVPAEDFCWGTTEEDNVKINIKLGEKS